jgi:hypothetical protein
MKSQSVFDFESSFRSGHESYDKQSEEAGKRWLMGRRLVGERSAVTRQLAG